MMVALNSMPKLAALPTFFLSNATVNSLDIHGLGNLQKIIPTAPPQNAKFCNDANLNLVRVNRSWIGNQFGNAIGCSSIPSGY
jgi:hypothetical protein